MQYTLAFIFSADLQKILLIAKNRPENQAGKLNGIGGKIEPNETPVDCMIREVREETSLEIPKDAWIFTGTIEGKNWKVWTYTTRYLGDLGDALSITDEPVLWYDVDSLPSHCMQNLFWLIPFAVRKYTDERMSELHCTYNA